MLFSEPYVMAAIVLLTVCCIMTRSGFFVLGDYIPLSESLRRGLRYAPVAALTAIVIPDLLPWSAGQGPSFDLKLLAALCAILIFFARRSSVLVIAVGMLALWGLRWFFA